MQSSSQAGAGEMLISFSRAKHFAPHNRQEAPSKYHNLGMSLVKTQDPISNIIQHPIPVSPTLYKTISPVTMSLSKENMTNVCSGRRRKQNIPPQSPCVWDTSPNKMKLVHFFHHTITDGTHVFTSADDT